MEDNNKEINKNFETFLKEKYSENPEDMIIKINQIDGMTNQNYQIIYNNKNEPKKINEVLYRKYGNILDLSEHDKEIYIMKYLSNKKEGPNVLYISPNYRIVEFVNDSKIIPLELRYEPKILDNVIEILCKYTLISNVYKYDIDEEIKINLYHQNENNDEYKFPSILDILEKLFIKAEKNYKKFNEKFNEYFSKNKIEEKIKIMKAKYDTYIKDYKNKFLSLFPKNGFFILCHNDCQRWNFLFRNLETKLLIIDHEYACLGLPGLDLCNYFNENSFYFYDNGNYEFKKEEINFNYYYEQYQKYCHSFIELNKIWLDKEENKEFLNLIQSKDYYLNLHSITNIFWFLFCVINLDFEGDIIKKSEHYFEYGYDRLCYSELAQKKD